MERNPIEIFWILLLGLGVGIPLVGGAIASIHEYRRRREFRALAARLGLRYRRKDLSLAQRYAFLNRRRVNGARYAFNVLEGDCQGHPVRVFDFHNEIRRSSKGRPTTERRHLSCFVLEHQLAAPELLILSESRPLRLGKTFGLPDIDFESNEFSRAFVVQCKDKRFAYDICHTRMMEYLLAHRDLSIEIERNCLSLSFDRRLKVAEIPQRLEQLLEIRDLFPNYLFRA
mgnify:CR=1 FL=1